MNEVKTTTIGNSVPNQYSPNFIRNIAAEYGTPLFLLWEKTFRGNCRRFKREFSFPGRKTIHSYSYKTNNIKALCAIAHAEGFGAEIVSSSELDMALELGVDGNRIFYNGPLKSKTSLQKAITYGAAIHIDSLSELESVDFHARTLGRTARVALRLTPEAAEKYSPVWNKFGLSMAEGEVKRALEIVAESKHVRLEGLHMHMGTNLTDSTLYGKVAKAMAEVAILIEGRLGYDIQYVDIGGGFSVASGSIPMVVHPEEWAPVSLREVVNQVAMALDQYDPEKKVSVVTEPGRFLAESAMSLLTRIVSIKERGSRSHMILDGGTNILPSAYYTKHPVSFPGKENARKTGVADFHGPLCTQFDVVASEIDIPQLVMGDLVLIHGAGAYTYTFSTQFTGPRPPVVLVSEQATAILVREKEPGNVLWQYDRLPTE